MVTNVKKHLNSINKDEKIKNISIVTIILYPIILLLANEIHINNYVIYTILGAILMLGVVVTAIENTKSFLILISIFFSVIIINYVFHLDTFRESIGIIIKNFVMCYLMFIIVVNIKNKDKLFNSLKIGGYIAIILVLIYIIMMRNNKTLLLENGLSIQLILSIFLPINLVFAFMEKKQIDIIFSIIGLILISSFSSRTIILSIWAFTILLSLIYYIKWYKKVESSKTKKMLLILSIIIILIGLIVFVNIKEISTGVYQFLNSKGIYNRTLRLISEGENFFNSSGRTDSVYPLVCNNICNSPIKGNGIGMDRVFIDNNVFYAHNLILEFYASYGIILGTLMIIELIVLILKCCKTKYKFFIIGLTFGGFFILMLTSSYTIYRGFWLMLGIIINIGIKNKGGNRMIKYALIGCGRISPNHLEAAVNNNLEIVGICDIVPEHMDILLEKLDMKDAKFNRYTDYHKMLETEKPDLVAIATESGEHAKIALDCLEAGANIIIEKPIALSLEDADKIIEKSKEKGLIVCANHQNRFNKSIQKIRSAVDNGDFGKMLYGTAHIRWNRGKDYYTQASWRGTWEQDGGALMNQCIHNIDLLRWMMGDEVTEVCAYTDNLNHDYIQAEDLGIAIVKFKNGSYGIIEGTTDIYPKNLEETLYLFGQKGTVKAGGKSVNMIEEWTFENQTEDTEIVKEQNSEIPKNVYGFGHTPLYKDVINAINTHTKPLVDAEAGRRALELVLAIYKSAAEGKPIKLPLDKCSTMDFVGRFDK